MKKIRKGDQVVVTTGRSKGHRGAVLRLIGADRVVVENANTVKRHARGNPRAGTAGGIIQKEAPVHISNVALYNPQTKQPDRVGIRSLDDGRRVRYFKSTGEVVDV
jgi:large subunit ribosomal protein L24